MSPAINIHISYLPWNRGADPNFWSWFDHTPKGVSIHQIETGIDTGPLLAQAKVSFGDPRRETLATTYNKLRESAVKLFARTWPRIRAGKIAPKPQQPGGSYHRKRDKERWWKFLSKGYDTPVSVIEEIGEETASEATGMHSQIEI